MTDPTQQPGWSTSYPVQSCTTDSPPNNPNINTENKKPHQLPATLRAIPDSQDAATCSRTLVVCLDGTGDQFDNDNSNIVNFVSCLKKDSPHQLTYYQSGIGTYDGNKASKGISAAVDMAFGSDLGNHVQDAYRFLMENYREGDKICLLGFSRGSYTVRCLAGMLHKVGLLPAHNTTQVTFAYKFYKDDTPQGWKLSAEFKQTFCTDVSVYFVGVWDCVASVGFIPRKLPFSKSPTNSISYFRHAMALDEHRSKFKVCQWSQQDTSTNNDKTVKLKAKRSVIPSLWPKSSTKNLPANGKASPRSSTSSHSEKKVEHDGETTHDKLERNLEEDYEKAVRAYGGKTNVLEVWFAGAHADCGGGAVLNSERHMLSRIPLRWMIRQTFECNTGIIFNTAALANTGLDVHTLWPMYIKPTKPVVGPSPKMREHYENGALHPIHRRHTALDIKKDAKHRAHDDEERLTWEEHKKLLPGDPEYLATLLPEQVEDHFDAISPINDQLVDAKGWWVLEFWPVKVKIQRKDSEGAWEKKLRMNLGRGRGIAGTELIMHWTVEMRMNDLKYKYKIREDRNAVWQVTA